MAKMMNEILKHQVDNICHYGDMMQDPDVLQKCVRHLLKNFPDYDHDDAEMFVHSEAQIFLGLISENLGSFKKPRYAQELTALSIFTSFMKVVSNLLSFDDSSRKDAYIFAEGNAMKLDLCPYGEAQLRINKGIIKHYDDPIVYYDCDEFGKSIVEGQESIYYEPKLPRPDGAQVKGVFMKIVRPDGSYYYPHFSRQELDDFKAKGKQKMKYENKAWESLEGMAKAKCIKHAFKRLNK